MSNIIPDSKITILQKWCVVQNEIAKFCKPYNVDDYFDFLTKASSNEENDMSANRISILSKLVSYKKRLERMFEERYQIITPEQMKELDKIISCPITLVGLYQARDELNDAKIKIPEKMTFDEYVQIRSLVMNNYSKGLISRQACNLALRKLRDLWRRSEDNI